jgi:hypothetical protein
LPRGSEKLSVQRFIIQQMALTRIMGMSATKVTEEKKVGPIAPGGAK